jgi:hypothetical protein
MKLKRSVRQVTELKSTIRKLRPRLTEGVFPVELIMTSLAAAAALLLGHFVVVVRNWLARQS